MIRLLIAGAGRHGRELEAYLGALAPAVELLGFIDEHRPAGPFGRSHVLGDFTAVPALLAEHGTVHFITATGDNQARRHLAWRAEHAGLTPWTLVHPQALVGPESELGGGSCLAPATLLTRNVQLGGHCIVNVGTTISHDCRIADFVNLNPGVTVCGDAEIGAACYIGAGATIIDKVTIGAETIVGAGAVVVDDLPPRVLALGVPARVARALDHRPKLV